MMRRDNVYWYGLALLLLVFGVFQALRPQPIDWRVTLESGGDEPYDLRALYTIWPNLAPGKPLSDSTRAASQLVQSSRLGAAPSTVALIGNEALTVTIGEYSSAADSVDYQSVVDFLTGGGTVFIAGDYVSVDLEPFGLYVDYGPWETDQYIGFLTPLDDTLRHTVRLTDTQEEFTLQTVYVSNALGLGRADGYEDSDLYLAYDTLDGGGEDEPRLMEGVGAPEVLATVCTGSCADGEESPILVRVPVGQGSVVVTTGARMLTNIALLDAQALPFAAAVARVLPDGPVVRRVDTFASGRPASPLYVLTRYPSLLWSWYTLLGLGLLAVVAYARRRQRPTPPRTAMRNETAAFVQTVAQLYRNRGDHANLTRKMATRFRHTAYDAFGLSRRQQTAEIVSERASMPLADAENLIRWVDRAEAGQLTTGSEVEEFADLLAPFFDRAPRTSRLPLPA